MPKTCLITGGFGFIGSHMVEHLLANTDWNLVLLASFRHKGDSVRGISFALNPRVKTYIHDCSTPISDVLINLIGPVDYIINAAAESHVDRSITDPVPFVQNNVNIALEMVEYCRKVRPEKIIQVSTDEVYGPALPGQFHKEWDVIRPSNMYSASKAAQEAIWYAAWRTHGLGVFITNTMNNFGERQDKEKYTAKIISAIANDQTLTIHASPTGEIGSRFYMHARNHADALLFLLTNVKPAIYNSESQPYTLDRFNVVGDRELDNLQLAQMVAEFMGKELKYELVDFHSSRPGHDLRYALDGSKMASIGWQAPVDLEQSMKKTVEWTLAHPEWL